MLGKSTDLHNDFAIFLSLLLFPNIFKYLSTFLVRYQVLRLYFHGNMHHNPRGLCLSLRIQTLLLYRLTVSFGITLWFSIMNFFAVSLLNTQSYKASINSLQVVIIFTILTKFYHSPKLSLKLTLREFVNFGCLVDNWHRWGAFPQAAAGKPLSLTNWFPLATVVV